MPPRLAAAWDFDDNPMVFRFSANVLVMPSVCCCCGGGAANRVYLAPHTRLSGKKVVRSQTKYWDFPICQPCSVWTRAVDDLPNFRGGWGIFKFGVGSAVISGIAFMFFRITSAETPRWICFAVSLVAFVLVICLWVYTILEWLRIRRERREGWEAALSIRPYPFCPATPVEYHGWDHSIHSFLFRNGDFASAFVSANQRKFVG